MLADRQIYRPTDKHHNNLFPYLGESRVINTRCKAKPDGSPPAYPPPPVNYWSVNWYACVQRSTCTSCRIPSHANPTLRIIAEIELPWHGLLAWSTINARRRCSVVVLVRWRRRPSESHVYYLHSWHNIGLFYAWKKASSREHRRSIVGTATLKKSIRREGSEERKIRTRLTTALYCIVRFDDVENIRCVAAYKSCSEFLVVSAMRPCAIVNVAACTVL